MKRLQESAFKKSIRKTKISQEKSSFSKIYA